MEMRENEPRVTPGYTEPVPEGNRPMEHRDPAYQEGAPAQEQRHEKKERRPETSQLSFGLFLLIAGVVVFATSFMSWAGDLSGIELATDRVAGAIGTNIFYTFAPGGYLVLTGFWTLMLGVLAAMSGIALMLGLRFSRGFAAILFGLGVLVAVINFVAIGGLGLGIGYGLYVLLIATALGHLAALVAMSPYSWPGRKPMTVSERETYGRPRPGIAMR